MKRKLLYLALIFIISCNKNYENSAIKRIQVEEKPKKDIIFQDFAKNIEFIELEASEKSLIGEIHKVIMTEDRILILDRKFSKSLFVFDRVGNFLNTIGIQGKGPGEFISPQDFNVFENNILIYCKELKKIVKYSLDNEFLEELKIDLDFHNMEKMKDGNSIYFSHNLYNNLYKTGELPYNFLAFTPQFDLINKQFKNNVRLGYSESIITLNRYFENSENGIFLNKILSDTLYKIEDFQAKPFLTIDFGDKKITESMKSNEGTKELMDRLSNDINRSVIRPIKVADSLIFIEFAAGFDNGDYNANYRIIHDLRNEKNIFYHNILDKEKNWKWVFPIDTFEDKFISVINPKDYSKLSEKKLNKNSNDSVSTNFKNQVLLLYNIKNLQ